MAVTLLDGDAVAAKPARHGDVDGGVEGDLHSSVFRCIKMHGIRQCIAARASACDDIDLACIYDEIFSAARIDARRIADAIFHLQMQGMVLYRMVEQLCRMVGKCCKYIGFFVAHLVRADVDKYVRRLRIDTCSNRIGIVAARLPYGIRVRCGCRRRAADLCGRCEVDRGKRPRHMVGGKHRHIVKKSSGVVRGEVLRRPRLLGRGIAVGVDIEICTVGDPETLRIILSVELTDVAAVLHLRDGGRGIGGSGEHVRYGRLVDMTCCLPRHIICEDVRRAVRQNLDVADILTRCTKQIFSEDML